MTVIAPVQANRVFRNQRALINYQRERSATEEGVYTIANPVSQMLRKGGLVTWNQETP